MIFFSLHMLTLFFFTYLFAGKFYRHKIDLFLSIIVIMWANIAITDHILSLFHSLGNLVLFFRISIFLSFSLYVCSFLFAKHAVDVIQKNIAFSRTSLMLIIFFLLSLSLILIANVLVVAAYPPNNYDSLTYHLPRAMFYLGHGSMQHFETPNIRQVFFPFNLSFLHMTVLQNGVGLIKLLSLVDLGFWVAAGLAIYRICRLAHHSVTVSIAAAWLALLATEVLAQSTTTMNDLPAATGLLIAVVFFQLWLVYKRMIDVIITALAIGLAFGTKLTAVFFIPPALFLSGLIVYRNQKLMTGKNIITGIKFLAIPSILFFLLGMSFIMYNLVSTGQWMTDQFDYIKNQPFSFASFLQTAKTFTLQFFLEPVQRLNFTFNPDWTLKLNHFVSRWFFPHWNEAYAFSPFYFFPPDFTEDHVWFGFAGGFILISAVTVLVRRWRHLSVINGLAILGLGWLFFYFALNKWSLYNQRYFVLPFLLMSPCATYYFEKMQFAKSIRSFKGLTLIGVFLATFWFAISYLCKNTMRPLLPVLKSSPKPLNTEFSNEMLLSFLDHKRIHMFLAGDNERVFPLMSASKAETFTSGLDIKKDAFNVISKWAFMQNVIYTNITAKESFILMPIAKKRTAGIYDLGKIGRHYIEEFSYFGLDAYAEQHRATALNSNILCSLKYKYVGPDRFMDSHIRLLGLSQLDGLQATVLVEYFDGTQLLLTKLEDDAEKSLPVKGDPKQFIIEVRDEKTKALVGRTNLPITLKTKKLTAG